ncbi:hypothetical protein GOODEAATRI_018118 [Goodea atripinnis]|uniref:Uncharacterized protein n=1 Tax=Goodea atripinnis TaxID=208336 RepID=A0ABV0N3S1_9TELE
MIRCILVQVSHFGTSSKSASRELRKEVMLEEFDIPDRVLCEKKATLHLVCKSREGHSSMKVLQLASHDSCWFCSNFLEVCLPDHRLTYLCVWVRVWTLCKNVILYNRFI